MGLTLLTHNWGFFLVAGCAAAALLCLRRAEDRRPVAIDAAVAFGIAGLLYLPWAPSLLDQLRHTGAPWSVHPTVHSMLTSTSASVGGAAQGALLLVVGGAGLWAARSPRFAGARSMGLIVTFVGLALAIVYCRIGLAWAPRYLATFAGPLIALASAGLAAFGPAGIAAAVVAVLMGIGQPHAKVLDNKTNVVKMAQVVNPVLRSGDLVISTQPEQTPALVRYLRHGLRYAVPWGTVSDPEIMDWRNARSRLRHAGVRRDLRPLLARVPVGGRVMLVNATTTPQGLGSEWARLVRLRKKQWSRALRKDHRFHRVKRFVRDPHAAFSGASATVYVKRRP